MPLRFLGDTSFTDATEQLGIFKGHQTFIADHHIAAADRVVNGR